MAEEDWGSHQEQDTGQPLSNTYKLGHMVSEIENIFGRQPLAYITKLFNDGLLEIGAKRQKATFTQELQLTEDQRWYTLPSHLIDITRVEIKYSNDRYVLIPKLSDSHTLLKGDDT